MVMVVVRAKGALWGADASLLQSLAVAGMYRGPTTKEVTLDFRGSANKAPAKSAHNQCSGLYITSLTRGILFLEKCFYLDRVISWRKSYLARCFTFKLR